MASWNLHLHRLLCQALTWQVSSKKRFSVQEKGSFGVMRSYIAGQGPAHCAPKVCPDYWPQRTGPGNGKAGRPTLFYQGGKSGLHNAGVNYHPARPWLPTRYRSRPVASRPGIPPKERSYGFRLPAVAIYPHIQDARPYWNTVYYNSIRPF